MMAEISAMEKRLVLGARSRRRSIRTLQFLTKPDKDSAPLRECEVDLETGVIDEGTAPELRTLVLLTAIMSLCCGVVCTAPRSTRLRARLDRSGGL